MPETNNYIDGTDGAALTKFVDLVKEDSKAIPADVPSAPGVESADEVRPIRIDWVPNLSVDLGTLRGLDDVRLRVVNALAAGDHVILIGPPGTGKTELAEAVAEAHVSLGLAGFK